MTTLNNSSKKRRRRGRRIASNDIYSTLILDEVLMGEVGFVSRDIWNELYGGITVEEDDGAMPITHIAISPSPIPSPVASASPWIVIPATIPPLNSSQFPTIPPSTILLPASGAPNVLWDAFESFPSSRADTGIKFPIQLTAINPIPLATIVVGLYSTGEEGEFDDDMLEDMVRKGLENVKVVHTGDIVRVQWMSVLARVKLCEPVDQGIISDETKVVVVRENRRKKVIVDGVEEDLKSDAGTEISSIVSESDTETETETEDEGSDSEIPGVSTFMNLTNSLTTPAISTPLPNGKGSALLSPSTSMKSAQATKILHFNAQPLSQKIPTPLLLPKPLAGEDAEARLFVRVDELMGLGCFSGDWVGIAGDGGLVGDRLMNGERAWRPAKVFSLPDSYAPKSKRKVSSSTKGIVYMSPLFHANLGSPTSVVLTRAPFLASAAQSSSPSSLHPQSALVPPTPTNKSPPVAKEVTLLRISTPTSTDRALQPALLAGLKLYFETARRIIKEGDLIPVSIDEGLGRSLFAATSNAPDGSDDQTDTSANGEELLLLGPGGSAGVGVRGSGKTAIAWFRVGSVLTSDDSGMNGSHDGSSIGNQPWGTVAIVDPGSTRMVQAGSEKGKIPPTISCPWEYYLGVIPPPTSASAAALHPALQPPQPYISPVHRRLRELISAATSARSIRLGLAPLAVLLTSTQRSIGKRTLASRAAADVGAHVFHIDAFDILGDGGQAGDVKTEAFLRARAERAAGCGIDCCVLLLTHIEAFTAERMVEVLRDVVGTMRIVIATTTDVDKVPEPIRSVFTHELEVSAPDEGERAGLLKQIAQERGVRLARDMELGSIAVKTAALVAGDLVDVVERAIAAGTERTEKVAGNFDGVTLRDIQLAGGDSSCLTKEDFEVAVDAARKNFADSIGAPKIPNVTWDDVGGLANVKDAVMETIQLPLERPELFAKGMKKRSGILFYGPPGTGKTLLAKAIATEFSLNFFSVKGPELLNMYIGESEANVRRVFQRARDARPCVVFFDELDSVAPKRGNQGDSGGVMDRIVSQLLAELDGMSEGADGGGGVFVIGATNRPDLLDPALLRPGRFDKMLFLGVSDTHEKQLTILEALTRKFSLHPSLSLKNVADTLPFTYTGADLYALCSDAMLKAITRQASLVDEKIKKLPDQPVTTAYFFDHLAGPEDVRVEVTEQDFYSARDDLVTSVSQKELEHYDKVRQTFEMIEDGKKKQENGGAGALTAPAKGKGKGKAKAEDVPLDTSAEQVTLQLNGTGDNGFGDAAGNDDEDLYGQ